MKGLSGMEGNLHVPFLGGWAGAISPGYPADALPMTRCLHHLRHLWLLIAPLWLLLADVLRFLQLCLRPSIAVAT